MPNLPTRRLLRFARNDLEKDVGFRALPSTQPTNYYNPLPPPLMEAFSNWLLANSC